MTATAKQQPDQLAAQPVHDIFKTIQGKPLGHDWLQLLPIIFIDQSNAAQYLD